MMLKPIAIILLMLVVCYGFGQQRFKAGIESIETEEFDPIDLVFKIKQDSKNSPYNVLLSAVFTSPQNRTLTVLGFYNDHDEYVIRFSPNELGNWSYLTSSSLPALSGINGSISVKENYNPNIHGAVTINPESPRKFSYEDGLPYFALAFELDWLFALDYGDNRDIPKTKKIIETIASEGFNQVVMNVFAYDVNWKVATNVPKEYSYGKPAYSVFKGDNQNPDFSNLNIDFFKHLDRVINHLNEKGIVAHLMIYVWNKNVNWPPMYSEEDNQFFDYVIKRYQGYSNIIWDVSKEALDYGRCDISYINERIARIRKIDAFQRLITVHDYEYCSREADQVDFISIQNWRSDLYSMSLEAYLRHGDKPVMNIEHGGYEEGPYLSFEGNYINAETCLIRNYECVFAGVYSTYYWQNTSWNIVVYDPLDEKHSFKKPRFDYYKHLHELFTRYNFNTLSPAKPKLTTNSRIGNDNLASSSYPLTDGNGLYMYLVPASNHQINVVLPEPVGGQMEATWFNPFNGDYKNAGTSKYSMWASYKSPWENTYSVLILQRK